MPVRWTNNRDNETYTAIDNKEKKETCESGGKEDASNGQNSALITFAEDKLVGFCVGGNALRATDR